MTPPYLLIVGSQRRIASASVEHLKSTGRASTVVLRGEDLLDAWAASTSWVRTLAQVSSGLSSGASVAVRLDASRLAVPGRMSRTELQRSRDLVVERLGELVMRVVSESRPGALVVVGGDTAYGVLSAIGAAGIVLRDEPLPGVPSGTIDGGVLDGIAIASKAGAFGREDTLAKIMDYLTTGSTWQ